MGCPFTRIPVVKYCLRCCILLNTELTSTNVQILYYLTPGSPARGRNTAQNLTSLHHKKNLNCEKTETNWLTE